MKIKSAELESVTEHWSASEGSKAKHQSRISKTKREIVFVSHFVVGPRQESRCPPTGQGPD